MSTCGFRGRGFVRRSSRPNGPAGGFAGPRFPHPNFNHTRPPPKRLPAPEKWGERPGGFPPWQANTNFHHRPQFRGNIHFRPNGRGRMPNGRGMVRFSGPGRPPGPQYPVVPIRLPMMPRAPFPKDGSTQDKTILSPFPGTQEERQQKIVETADKLKEKLSSITQEEMINFWEDDFTGEQTNYASEQEQQKGSKVAAELRDGPPELDLTFRGLRDIGMIDSSKLEGEGCLEEIVLLDDFDNNVSRFESTNDEISITYSSDNDVVVISSTDIECINPGATINSTEEKKSHKEATPEIFEVTAPYSDGSNENVPCTSASETAGSFAHVLSDTEKDTPVVSGHTTCKNVPETVAQQLKQTKFFEEAQKDSSIRKKAAKSPSVLQTIPLHKQKCIPLTDVSSENVWNDTLNSPSSNNEDTTHEINSTSSILPTTYTCQPFSGLNYTEVQIPSGSGFCSKTHNELASFAPRGPNQKYHWPHKGSNRFPIGPQNKPEHSHQMPLLRPRMTPQQLNPVTFSPCSLSNSLITNSSTSLNNSQQSLMPVCSNDLPLNFDPAKPPPNIRPTLMSNKGNLETPVTFNTRGLLPHIPMVGSMTDSLPGFNHQDPPPKLYNHDDTIRPQQKFSPRGFLPEQSNLITITPSESVPMNLMDMTSVTEFSLESTATNFVQLPSVPPSPHQPFMSNRQMNFSPAISNRNAEQLSHNLQLPACSPIEVTQLQAPPPLPEELLINSEDIDDQHEATINDGLEDMQEAMKFAKQIMNLSEQMENSDNSEIPLPKASPSNNDESLAQSSLRIAETVVEGENTSGESKRDCTRVVDTTAEKTLEPQKVEKTNHDEDTDAQNTLLIDELMRPKVIFNLNSKLKRISKVEDWHHQNEEARQRKVKATNQISECKKVSRLPSLQTSNIDNSNEDDLMKMTLNKTCKAKEKQCDKRNNQDTEVQKSIGPRIVDDVLVCKTSEKSRVSLISVKTANNVLSQKPEKLKRGQKPVAGTAELSWKNRVINRFLKMSKNDICNMVNNSSLRKFDIAMKHLVKEKRSSLSLELRNTEDEKIKGYDQEEFMSQLNAMLDPSATVDITNLPTAFIHHLSEVLQLDPMPFETDNSIQSSIEAKEPFSSTQCSTHAASGSTIADESSLNSTDAQLESKNSKVVLDASKDESQTSSLEHNSSVSDILKRSTQQSPLVIEEVVNEMSHKTQRPLFNATDLDNILSVITDKPKDCIKDAEVLTKNPLKDNTTLQSQQNVNNEPVEFPLVDDCNETIAVKKIVNPIINISSVRPRKSTSEDRSTFKLQTCQRWSRKEREDLDAFRNLTKEEWEAKYGKEIGSGTSTGSRRSFSNTRTVSYRTNHQHHIPEPVNSDVTKLLKVIKEKENIAKKKSINETIRDEVTAEIEKKRKEKIKYKEKRCSSKHSKRRTERRGKHGKRMKGKRKRKGLKNSSTESDDESSEHCILDEDEIKKEIVVKEEVVTPHDKNLSPNGVTISSGTTAKETHNIMGPIHVLQVTEQASELQPTAGLSVGACSTEQQKVRNTSPCAMLALQPKTKAQLKQMPELTNVDQQLNTDQPCQATISVKNVVTINCDANKGINKNIEEVDAKVERLKPDKNDQPTVFDSAGKNNIALSEAVMQPANLNCGKLLSPERSSSTKKTIKTNRIDEKANSYLPLPNPKMSKLFRTTSKHEKFVKSPNCRRQQKPLDSSLHTVTPNMSKDTTSKPKKIDIKVYKERALQRRLREEGKLEKSGDKYSLIEKTSSTSIKAIVHKSTGDPSTVKEACLPGTSKDDANVTELNVDSSLKDSHVPETLASCTSFFRKNGSRKYTENITADNSSSNSMTNSSENDKFQSKILTSVTNGMLESETNVAYKSAEEPKTISKSVGIEATKKVEFKKNQRKRRKTRQKLLSKSQDKNFNLFSIDRRTGTSTKEVSEKVMMQEIESQVGNKFDNLMQIEEKEVNENHSNKNSITNVGEAKDDGVSNNSKTESPDMTDKVNLFHQFDSPTENILHVLTPIKINEAHAVSQDVEKENRPMDVVTHNDDRVELFKDLHSNTHANQDSTTSYIEDQRILPTSPKTRCVAKTAPEPLLISADKSTSFEPEFSKLNGPPEIQTKESSHNQLLSLETNTLKEENALQYKIHDAVTNHNTIEPNGAQSGDINNDITADLENVKEILVSHTSNTKESINKYDGICNAISAESSSSPFAGFGQEWNQDYMYNEKIASLEHDKVDTQLPSPSCDRSNANLTKNLLSEKLAMLPRVTSEVTIKSCLIIGGINDRGIFNEDTRDTPSSSTKELSDNSNTKISLEQSCVRDEHDLILKSETPMDPLNRDSNSYIVLSEYINTEDDNSEQYPKTSPFKPDGYTNIEKNSCDGDDPSKLHPRNLDQAYIGSPKDHDYSSKHQHVVNDTTNVDEQHYSRPMSNTKGRSGETAISIPELTSSKDKSANIVYTEDESQTNTKFRTSLKEEHNELNDTTNPSESTDLLTDITNETNSVERVTAPLEIISSEHDNSTLYNVNQENQHESFKVLAFDSPCCSTEVPKKLNVPTKAALKASGENVFASSATASLKDPKVTEASTVTLVTDTLEDFQRNSLSIEVGGDLSRANRAKEINPEADVRTTDVSDIVNTNDDLSPGTDRSKTEGIKQTPDRTHKTVGKNTKQSKGEQIDELHKIKNKPDLKRKHGKKQNLSEKVVSDALQSGLVQVGEPNTKESVMARMIEIDLQIHKLMTEKMKLYQLLENDAVPSEATLQSVTPMPVSDEQCTSGPSVLASQLVQKIDVSAVLHQPVHKTNETTAQHNVHSTSSAKRKSSTRKEHSHRKRIALSYSSDEENTNSSSMPPKLSVSKKTASCKDAVVESLESLSRARSTTPERITEKKRHSEKLPHGDAAKSSRHKVSSDIKEEHSDRKSVKGHKPTVSDDTKRKTVSPNAENKHSKKGHKDKPIIVKSISNVETDRVRRKSEVESDNNQSLISPKNDFNKRNADTCVPTHTRRESSSEKPQETKMQPIKNTDDNLLRQAAKSCEDVSGNELRYDAKKQLLNDPPLEDKRTNSTRSVSEARTSEGLSIYSDDSTWESFLQNAPDESNDQKKPNTGLALLEMSYKKEMAKSRKLKALTRRRKKKHPESVQTVNSLTSDEEELSLSTLYKKKLQQKKNLLDSMDSKVDEPSYLDYLNNSQNLDKIINAVAEDRVQDLYIEQQPALLEKSNNQETKLHTEFSKPNCDIQEIQNNSRLKLQTLAGETERLKDDTHILIGKNNFELKITEKATQQHSLHVEQSIDLPILQKSVDLSDNKINEDMHGMVDEHSITENQQDIEMPRLYPLIESCIDNNECIAKSTNFSIGNLETNASNAQESVCDTRSVTSCPESVKVNKEPEELISGVESDPKIIEESKDDKFGRKKKNESNVLEESFKPQRSRRDSAQSTDTMTTDSNSGTNQELPRRKYMKWKRKNNKLSIRKRSKLTEENVKRIRLDIDASVYSNPDTDSEGKVSATPVGNKSLEKASSSKEIISVATASRKRSISTSKLQNNRKYSTNTGDDDIQTVKQISIHKKQCEPQICTQKLKNCEVRLVDSKYTLLRPNVNPGVLRRYGISKINPYLENSENTGENQILSLQSSAVDSVPNTCIKQNTSLAEGNLINDTSEIQIIKDIDKHEDSSKIKLQNFENDITLVRDRRPSSGDEISVIPTRNLQTANISQGSDVPDIEIVQEVNPAKVNSQDGPEVTLSVIEPNDDEDPSRTQYTVHKGPILDIKVFGNTFLAASEDGTIYRYSQASNGILNIYKGHKAAVTCLYVYTVGLSDSAKAWMFSGSLDGTLRCYNITTGTHIRDAVDIESPVQCLDEAWGIIFVGTKSGHVSRYYIKSGALKGESIQFSDKSVLALKATNEGSRRVLIVASRNQPITIRDAQTGLFLRTISGQKSHTVYSLMRHNNLIYCGTSSTSIPVFDFTDGEEIVQYHAGVGIVCMRLYANLLFAGCYDGNIYIFNTKDHRLICSTPGPGNMLLSMEIVDNKIIAGSKDRRLQSWQMPKQVRSLLLRVT